ncbi:hypothetical protein FF38_01670 [Lucilia cuprina]|uniref:Uncharacterized protein n=1 Tax=Lucilia cuprina TaxID=7375 RepID=A0A0L0BRJ1_LUCCU|nr:hypothetical protein FF38_01670 [Lucilia cuprina]
MKALRRQEDTKQILKICRNVFSCWPLLNSVTCKGSNAPQRVLLSTRNCLMNTNCNYNNSSNNLNS